MPVVKDKIDPRRCNVFFDFDNTITTYDVLDNILIRFSEDDRWIDLEHKWKKGDIGSMECLKGQLEGVRITRNALNKYLATVKIDPHFKPLIKLLASKNIKTMILSDNFDYILINILERNKILGVDIYSNVLRIIKDRLMPTFPLADSRCGNCAHCKKTTLLKNRDRGSLVIYIGDGRSDVCASEKADMIFAKGYLKEYCKTKRLAHIPFNTLKDVYRYLERSLG